MAHLISRRRMIAISASFAGGTLIAPHSLLARTPSLQGAHAVSWHGISMGADAQIKLFHNDANAAREILTRCRKEITRLEKLFSLYRPASAINSLNREGELVDPAPEMLELVSNSLAFGAATQGAFDITVQPLWQLYSDHFKAPRAPQQGPSVAKLKEALRLVDYKQVDVSNQRISFKRPGMAITLNGIAQGYITDKVASLLRAAGYKNVLVHLGETYAMGRKDNNQPWIAGIQDPQGGADLLTAVPLENLAMATSGGYGTTFSTSGEHHHLFDPRTGRSTNNYQSVSVIAPNAQTADALSTAFSSLDQGDIKQVLKRRSNVRAVIVKSDNKILEL